jgi:hypothetical protein
MKQKLSPKIFNRTVIHTYSTYIYKLDPLLFKLATLLTETNSLLFQTHHLQAGGGRGAGKDRSPRKEISLLYKYL